MFEVEDVAAGEGFHQLGYRQYASGGVSVQDVERGVAVDQQGRDGAVDGSKRDVR